jgi:hypothetical protein
MHRAIRIFSVVLPAVLATACGRHDDATAAASHADPAASASEVAAAAAPAANASSAIVDACALVTQADAESVLGTPAKLSESEKDDKHASHCSYEAVDQASGVNMLGVEIHTDEDANEAKTSLAINRKMYSSDASGNVYVYETLAGIGNDAFLVSNKVPQGIPPEMAGMLSDQQMVFAAKGGKDIHIITSYSGKQRSTDSLKALAKKLADHI